MEIQNNLNKSIELSNKFKCITIGERCKNIEDACYKMAQWKDKCFSDVIKRLKETYQLDEQALFILNLVESRYNDKK